MGNVLALPTHIQPATVTLQQFPRLTGLGLIQSSAPAVGAKYAWVLDNIQFPKNIYDFIKGGYPLVAVSDGSFKQGHGTAAWIIYFSDTCSCVGRVVVPGTPEDHSAYRSELTGLYAIAASILFIERRFGFSGPVTVGCDGLSVLHQVSNLGDFIDPTLPQYDLILATRTLVQQAASIQWKWQHVKGHQDDNTPVQHLDLLSRLNVQMDLAAKQHWACTVGTQLDVPIEGEPWQVRVEGRKITSQLRESLRQHATAPKALEYWRAKKRFKHTSVQNIDWQSFGAAMRSTPTNRQRWVSKTTSGFCATGIMMHRRKERSSPACPRCGMVEDVEHIWRCQHETYELWSKAMNNLNQWLVDNGTHPDLRKNIIRSLNAWRLGNPTQASSTVPWIQDALSKQHESGWRNFFEGFLVQEWRNAQDQFLARTQSRRSSKRWVSALVQKMWQIAWDLWEHRNGYLHEQENNLISVEVNQSILAEFKVGCRLLDRNTRALFQKGSSLILSKPLEIRVQWVRRVRAAREQVEVTEHQACYQAERKVMAQWLGQA
jgi:hypothetical protein